MAGFQVGKSPIGMPLEENSIKKFSILLCIGLVFFGCGDLGSRYPRARNVVNTDERVMAQLDQILKKYTDENGYINYTLWRKNKDDLSVLRKVFFSFAQTDLSKLSANEQKAYYINAHNIIVVWLVMWKYGATSSSTNIKDVRSIQNLAKPGQSPFDSFQWKIAHQAVTLTDIRKKYLTPFGDARVHLALTMATKSMPLLHRGLMHSSQLNEALDELAKSLSNSKIFTQVNTEKKTIQTSEIFNWHKEDFEKQFSSLNEFFVKYINPSSYDPKIIQQSSVSFLEFDWTLNEIGETPPLPPPPEEPDDDFFSCLKDILTFIKCEIFGFLKLCDKTVVDTELITHENF